MSSFRSFNDKDDDFRQPQSTNMTFTLLTLCMTFTGVVSWMTIYSITALPGDKFINGIICGGAECLASLTSGLLIKLFDDKKSFMGLCAMYFGFQVLY